MARPLRLEFAHGFYHVTSRGDGREDIYRDNADRALFLEVLSETVDRFNRVIHAYCLMGNHYHLLIETPDGNLSHWHAPVEWRLHATLQSQAQAAVMA